MFLPFEKQMYHRAFLCVAVYVFGLISTIGILGSTEMQVVHHQQNTSIGSSLASSPDRDQPDHLEDLVTWNNFGTLSTLAYIVALATLLLLSSFFILPLFNLFVFNLFAQILFILRTKPPSFSFAVQEAFSRGLINGKVF